MKTSKKAFGENYAEKFKIGDLIWWITWEQKEDFSIDSVQHRGVLIEIINEPSNVSGKENCMAKVLPFGSQKTIKLNIMLLRKETN
jgi:hypothetical protein